jgi:hypothetical protein
MRIISKIRDIKSDQSKTNDTRNARYPIDSIIKLKKFAVPTTKTNKKGITEYAVNPPPFSI